MTVPGPLTFDLSQAIACRRGEKNDVDLDYLRQTIEALYVTRHSLIFRYLLALSRDPGEAGDVTHEAFLRLFDHCASGHTVDNVVNYP